MNEQSNNATATWRDSLNDKERQMVEFARTYVREFPNVGAPGHNWYFVIDRMAAIMDVALEGKELPPPPPPQPTAASMTNLATEKQLGALFAIGKSAGLSVAEVKEVLSARLNCPVEAITRWQASQVIDEWKSQPPTAETVMSAIGAPTLPGIERGNGAAAPIDDDPAF